MISRINWLFLFVLGTILLFDGVMWLINCHNTFANIVGFLLIPAYITTVYLIIKFNNKKKTK